MNGSAFDAELDVRQLACPLPILRAKKSLSAMSAGQVLKVVATDKGSPKDFVDFCSKTGNELLSSTEAGGEFVFLIRRR
ncbi:sulfurtransferase TusA family protein [Sideroxydans lithotrophicus]|uniref:SirA family protein n=1 Tax=Sideroxydans lithotrophicus (strain ES-1) TaxID=580332 RepID=D5CMG8_SIDLE|nr:sulfurtransferase TusA family protein [Sideroxydans lithotrophicus]ADE12640.1 SirA family protein [Sideroxydans lithotrophicus ES-1]